MFNGKLKWLLLGKGMYTELKAKKNNWSGKIIIGKRFLLGKGSILERYMGGNLNIEDGVVIHQNCKISTCGGDIHIGSNTTLGDYTTITAQGGVQIGKNVIFADHVTLIASEHNYLKIDAPIMNQGSCKAPIYIGDGSWCGVNVTLLAGTEIGKNSVVAAGAVVKGKFPDYCVIGGVPARVLKCYDVETAEWRKL